MQYKLVDGAGEPLDIEDIKKNDVGPGWGDIIDRLIPDLFALGWNGEVKQVKEKFGSLRFYVGAATPRVLQRIDQAELESSSTCDQCGRPGKTSDHGLWWMRTLCPLHAEKRIQEQKKLEEKA